jgi:hypothetical protein
MPYPVLPKEAMPSTRGFALTLARYTALPVFEMHVAS